MVQWLRLWAPNAGGLGSIPDQETRSHTPQLRPDVAKQTKKNFIWKISFKKDLKKGKVAWRKNLWAMERGMSDVWELSINSTQQEARVGQQTWIPCAGEMLPRPKVSCGWCCLEGEGVGRRPPLGRQCTFPSGRRNDFSEIISCWHPLVWGRGCPWDFQGAKWQSSAGLPLWIWYHNIRLLPRVSVWLKEPAPGTPQAAWCPWDQEALALTGDWHPCPELSLKLTH